jgi:hypothetical protein
MTSLSDTPKARAKPLRLHFEDKRQVVVHSDDDDVFCTTVAEAARACAKAEKDAEFKASFEAFLVRVNAWSKEHETRVLNTYVVPMSHGLEVFVVVRGKRYGFDFDDEVTRLDLELSKSFRGCPVHVMQMPEDAPEALESFFSASKALQVYGS